MRSRREPRPAGTSTGGAPGTGTRRRGVRRRCAVAGERRARPGRRGVAGERRRAITREAGVVCEISVASLAPQHFPSLRSPPQHFPSLRSPRNISRRFARPATFPVASLAPTGYTTARPLDSARRAGNRCRFLTENRQRLPSRRFQTPILVRTTQPTHPSTRCMPSKAVTARVYGCCPIAGPHTTDRSITEFRRRQPAPYPAATTPTCSGSSRRPGAGVTRPAKVGAPGSRRCKR